MTFAYTTSKTRRVEPKHKLWVPEPFMERAVDFLLDRGAAILVLDPGLRKTSATLEAFRVLQEEGTGKRMLVVAPLRVCQLVWRQEAAKWTQFRHFKITLLHGPNKKKRLDDDSDIFLINPEGVRWLAEQYYGKKFPFDTVVFDELTKFKNAQAKRHKKILPRLAKVARRWGLTGSFLPNGYLNLFGQMKILDGGVALGFYFSHYRNKYFERGYTGFDFELRRGAAKAIEELIRPYVLRMDAEDYIHLPPLIPDIISIVMPRKARKHYEEMKKEMMVMLDGDLVEAGNAAAVYSKLKQMANGAVYAGDGIFEPRRTIHIHDAKIDALVDLIDDLNGAPLFVAYEFNHDLKRIQKALGGNVPYIGAGVSGAKVEQIERDWNANRLPVLLAHPASAGHGLNFQLGNACHVAWFSCTWDYELYDQFIRRIRRSGNEALRIFNHIFIVEDTIDNKTQEAIAVKGFRQSKFYAALNAEVYHGVSPNGTDEKEEPAMAPTKLSRRGRKMRKPEPEAEVEEEYEDGEEGGEEERPARASRRSNRGKDTKRKLRGQPESEVEEDGEGEYEDGEGEEEKRPSRSSRRSSRGGEKKRKPEPEEEYEDGEEEQEPVSKRARRSFSKSVQDKLPDDGEEEYDDDGVGAEDDGAEGEGLVGTEEDGSIAVVVDIDYEKLAAVIVKQMGMKLAG